MLEKVHGWAKWVAGVIAILTGLFHIYTAIFGVLDAYTQRSVHLMLMLTIIYLYIPASKKHYCWPMRIVDFLLAGAAVAVGCYQLQQGTALIFRNGFPNSVDIVMGLVLIVLILEAVRRTIGLPLTIVCLAFLLYDYFGRYMPKLFAHGGYSIKEIVNIQFMSTQGIFTTPIGVMSTYVVIFVIFGTTLNVTGASNFFNNLAKSLVGHRTGGPAKVSVIASAFMGTVSGSVVANVVTTGSFTIPMMKELGYRDEFAGAVEASASTGGQIMPPIMGAAAFMMADFLGIPYVNVALAAALPAVLYFISIAFSVHLEAKKYNLKRLPKDQLPKLSVVMKDGGVLLIPLVVLTAVMLMGYTAMRSGLAGILSLVIVVLFIQIKKAGLKQGVIFAAKSLVSGIREGVFGCLSVTAATAAAGIIIGTVSQSGLGLRLTSIILHIAGDSLLLTLILMAIACLILGMGMPTAGAYIIVVTLGVPALVSFGVPALAAHMFVFYMAIVSAVTPPVATGAYAAAGISGASPWKTGITAFRLDLAGFLIPFVIVYAPALVLEGTVLETVSVFCSALLGLFFISVAFEGYMLTTVSPVWRVVAFAGGILMVIPGTATDIAGLVLLAVIYALQRKAVKQAAAT